MKRNLFITVVYVYLIISHVWKGALLWVYGAIALTRILLQTIESILYHYGHYLIMSELDIELHLKNYKEKTKC